MQNFMASTYTYHIHFCRIIRTRYLWMFVEGSYCEKWGFMSHDYYEIFVLANYLQSTSRELARPAAGGSSADWWPTAARLQCTVSGPGTWLVVRQNNVCLYCQFSILIERYFCNLHLFRYIGGTNICMFAKSVPMCAALSPPRPVQRQTLQTHCRQSLGPAAVAPSVHTAPEWSPSVRAS